MVELESAFQEKAAVILRKLLNRLEGNFVCLLHCRLLRVVLYLHHQRRNQVEGHVEGGEIPEDRHHPEVILQRVQARPRHGVPALRQILVIGLVHVPKQHQIGLRHGIKEQFLCGAEIGVLA